MNEILLQLALRAMDDEESLPVLGDLVLETQWFDRRVMQTMWPRSKRRVRLRTERERERERIARKAWDAGLPEFFRGLAAKPTKAWARAIVAVLLFGKWPRKRFPLGQGLQLYSNAYVTANGVPLTEVSFIRFEGRADPGVGRVVSIAEGYTGLRSERR